MKHIDISTKRLRVRELKSALSVAATIFISLTLAAQAPAPPQPSAEHQKLGMLLGKWNFDGQAQVSPYGPAGRNTSTDTFAWLPGNFFMEHHWDANQAGTPIVGTEIIGYDGASKSYTSQFFDNFGNSGSLKGNLNGNTWTWTAESVVAGKPLKERGTVVVNGDTMTSKWEYSTDGTNWLPNIDLRATRAR